jgi:hypothetical protein
MPLHPSGQLLTPPPSPWGAFDASCDGASNHPHRSDARASVLLPRPCPWRLGLRLPPLLHADDAMARPGVVQGRAVPCWALRRLLWHGLAWPGAAVATMATSSVCSPRCVLLLLSLTCTTSSPTFGCLGIHCSGAPVAMCVLLLCCCSCGCACAAAMLVLLLLGSCYWPSICCSCLCISPSCYWNACVCAILPATTIVLMLMLIL